VGGWRIQVLDILNMLAGGGTAAQILADFASLEAEDIPDIPAILAYAARASDYRLAFAAEQRARFLIDARLPPVTAEWIRGQGHKADHVFGALGACCNREDDRRSFPGHLGRCGEQRPGLS
jgi:uncharacterized protein (DUF433 family)